MSDTVTDNDLYGGLSLGPVCTMGSQHSTLQT